MENNIHSFIWICDILRIFRKPCDCYCYHRQQADPHSDKHLHLHAGSLRYNAVCVQSTIPTSLWDHRLLEVWPSSLPNNHTHVYHARVPFNLRYVNDSY